MAHIQTVQRKNGKSYKAVIKKGDRVVATKTFRGKTLAKQWARRIEEDDAYMRALGTPGARKTFSEVASEYCSQWRGKDRYRPNQVAWWAKHLGDTPLIEITADHIEPILDGYAAGMVRVAVGRKTTKQTKKQRKPATVNRHRAALAAVFKYAISRRYITKNPVHQIPALPENNKRIRYLSDSERSALLAACKQSEWHKMYLLVLMAICTGARKSEMLNLRWSDVNFMRRIASVRMTKNGDPRELPLPQVVTDELMCHREIGNGLVFGSTVRPGVPFEYKKHWQSALEAAELIYPTGHPKQFRFHDLRHTAASYLVQNGATLYETAEVLGHRSIETTKRYAHLDTGRKQKVTDRVFGSIFRESK